MTELRQSKLKIWLKAPRPQFFTASVIPISLGGTIAFYHGHFYWSYFFLALFGGILIHAGLDLANDYFDHLSRCDDLNPHPTPFSGGSRLIQGKLIPAKQMLIAAIVCFALACWLGILLAGLRGSGVLIIGLLGVFIAWFYTAPPFKLGYSALGEFWCGLGFGPLMLLGSYYVQMQKITFETIWASLPVGLLIAAVLYINEFPDYEADKAVGKRTLIVRLGKKRAVKGYHLLMILAYLSIMLGIVLKIIPLWTFIALLSFPLALKGMKVAQKHYEEIEKLLPANAITITTHFLTGVLLCLGYIIAKLTY